MAPVRKTVLKGKKKSKEIFIWCDESDRKGKFFSDFYGGVLVESIHLKEVYEILNRSCKMLHLKDEIKWHKVSSHYLDKYKLIMDTFFDLIEKGQIKVRIMFTQNAYRATNLNELHKTDGFFILYYQFIKHAFGLSFSNTLDEHRYLRIYFDYLPDTLERRQQFKEYIKGLQTQRKFRLAKLKIRKTDIAEVDSKKHLVLQMLDVVLGSICFRLNNKHKEIPEGKKRRGKRTIAKESLYKHINKRIRKIKPGFNVGKSTGKLKMEDLWLDPYRHWLFKPSSHEIDETSFK